MDELETILDTAIRRGLVECGRTGRLAEEAAAIRASVIDALRASDITADEAAEAICDSNGFVRVGSASGAIVHSRGGEAWIDGGKLIDALLINSRREAE